MRNFQDLNDTSKYLSHLIFKPGSMTSLLQFGLENVYIDDFKHRCKYAECLLFLVDPIYPTKSKTFEEFQEKIINFSSFYDYYEIDNKTMYVFKIPESLIMDYHIFRLKQYHNLSNVFWESMGTKSSLDFNHVKFDVEKEIYRFNTNLKVNVQNVRIKKGE